MTAFLIKSTLSMGLFLLFYKLVLEREKMHQINRGLLLFALVFSMIVPFLSFELVSENLVMTKIPSYVLPEIYITNHQAVTPTHVFTLENVLWIIYSVGFLVFLIRFIRNIISLMSRIHGSEKIKKEGHTLVLVSEKVLPHSFLNYVFVNKQEYETDQIDNELFIHEKAHIAQKHSLDILFVELLQMVFWFNPVIYLYKKAIKLNHEFLADQTVNQTFGKVAYYQQLLLQKSTGKTLIPIASNLNYSVTKKRFIMMTKNTSTFNLASKTGLSIIVFSSIFFFFSVKMTAQEKKQSIKYEIPDTNTGKLKEVKEDEYRKYLETTGKLGHDTDAYYVEAVEGESEKDNSVPHITVSYEYLVEKKPEYFDPVTKKPLKVTLEDVKVEQVESELTEGKIVTGNFQEPSEKAEGWGIEYSIKTIEYNSNKSLSEQEPIYTSVEIMPEYPGGIDEFRKFVMTKFKTPKLDVALIGMVLVQFVVEKDGSLSNIKAVRDLGHGTAEEAVRVVGLSEKWNPGIQDGKPVRVQYTLPIQINIEVKEKPEE